MFHGKTELSDWKVGRFSCESSHEFCLECAKKCEMMSNCPKCRGALPAYRQKYEEVHWYDSHTFKGEEAKASRLQQTLQDYHQA